MQKTLFEKPADLPDFETALRNLGRVPLGLYGAFEYAASKVAEFRGAQCPGELLDECLSACLFRFHALRFLRTQGIDAQADEDFSLDRLSFLGISFHYAGYHVRVLKGPDGELPGCGASERKTRFFNQLPAYYLVDGKIVTPTGNLIVTWAFEANYGLGQLWLVLPATGGPLPKDVAAFWWEPIPHPAEGLQGVPIPPSSTPPPDDLEGMVARLDEAANEEVAGQETKIGNL